MATVAEEYEKKLAEATGAASKAIDVSTAAQIDALSENKKLVEAEKQNAVRGAYGDYMKNVDPYGVQSEKAYASGLGGAGKGETAKAQYYSAYQNRVGQIDTAAKDQLRDLNAQEATVRANAEAQKQNLVAQQYQNSADALWTQKNVDLQEAQQEEARRQFDTSFAENQRQYDTSFSENQRQYNEDLSFRKAQAEEAIRQYNETLAMQKAAAAEDKRQFDEQLALQKAQAEEAIRQYNETLAFQKEQANKPVYSSGGSTDGSAFKGFSTDEMQMVMDQLSIFSNAAGARGSANRSGEASKAKAAAWNYLSNFVNSGRISSEYMGQLLEQYNLL